MSSRPRIPLFDSTAPVACTLTDAEMSGRVAQLERMRGALRSLDRTPHGLLLHFDPSPETQADLRAFIVDEKQCCRFWGFAVEPAADDLRLVWDGPPTAEPLLDALAAFLTGDAPLDDVRSLL